MMAGAPTDDTPTVISTGKPRAAENAQLGEGLQGRRLGHFELLEAIGVGGMAAVLRARDLDLNRFVALKILPPESAADPENISRFKHEARAAAKLDHENIARVYFCGEDQGLHFIAFEYVEGENLRSLFDRRGPLPAAECVPYMLQVAAGLTHAARRGVIHRDIKPSNIIITPEGRAKIVDMGLARNLDARHAADLTQSGVTLGTFDYISPEQALDSRQADVRSDIYSLGCTFYHLLTGRPPVEGSPAKKLNDHQHVLPIDPRQINPAVPDDLAAVLGKMMAKDPAHRYQTPEQLILHLNDLARKLGVADPTAGDEPAPATPALPGPPRLSPVAIALAAAALVVVVVLFTSGGGVPADGPGPTALWPVGPPTTTTTVAPVNPGAAAAPGKAVEPSAPRAQKAPDAARLKALLQAPSAHIQLADALYDLAGELGVSFQGSDLVLEGTDRLHPPRLRVAFAPAGDGPRPGGLTLRGLPTSMAPTRLKLRGLHFLIANTPAESAPADWRAALKVEGFDEIDIERCTFEPEGPRPASRTTDVLLAGRPDAERTTVLRLTDSYFAPPDRLTAGDVAVLLDGSADVRAFSCVFAPYTAVFEAEAGAKVQLELDQCSALLRDGTLIQSESGAGVTAAAGHCLFACAGPSDGGELTRADASATAVLAGLKSRRGAMPNGYFNLSPPADDAEAVVLTASPWQKNPLEETGPRLSNPRAFLVNLDDRNLRLTGPVDPRPGRPRLPEPPLGALALPTDETPYSLSPSPPIRTADAKRKLVKRTATRAEVAAGVFRSLALAVEDAESGDVIEIQHDGLMEIAPVVLEQPKQLTIRPSPGSRPVLALKPTERKEASLFLVFNGSLKLEELQFLLRPSDRAASVDRSRLSAVTIGGAGQCAMVRCAATLDEGDAVQVAMASLADPAGAMKMGTTPDRLPRVELDRCFVRGKGDLLAVQPSRAFEFEADGSLFVLDGALVAVESASKEPPLTPGGSVHLRHTTAYLTGPILGLHGGERNGGPPALAGTQVTTDDCLFALPAGKSAVRADGLDPDQLKLYLSWRGKNNVYAGFTGQIIDAHAGGMSEMPQKMFRDAEWLTFTGESGHMAALSKVRFAVAPPTAGQPMTAVRPTDFAVTQWPDPRDAECGAKPRELPRPFDYEKDQR
jgi:hypothetical protein